MQQVLGAQKIVVSEILDRAGIVSVEMPDDYDLEQPLSAPLAVVHLPRHLPIMISLA